ncbi:MAG: phosphoserine phosphatase SerB [Aestuariivita sp.]|nr:phosphoserine phosphatase SerB [Aestuariivita sp.]
MFVVTLLTKPNSDRLEQDLVESLRQKWDGTDFMWLAPKEVAEFSLSDMPLDREVVWTELQAKGIDLLIQFASRRRKAILLADMDSTIIRQECINELAIEMGIGPQVQEITARAMNGELNFEESLISRVRFLEGQSEKVIDTVWNNRIDFALGAQTLLQTLRAFGVYTVLVSGGFSAFTSLVAKKLGFDEHHANQLLIKDGKLLGKVARPILGRSSKVKILEEVTQRLGFSKKDVISVGDGANDLDMLRASGTGIALHAKPALAAKCDMRVNFGDLTSLLYLQGYSRDLFVKT